MIGEIEFEENDMAENDRKLIYYDEETICNKLVLDHALLRLSRSSSLGVFRAYLNEVYSIHPSNVHSTRVSQNLRTSYLAPYISLESTEQANARISYNARISFYKVNIVKNSYTYYINFKKYGIQLRGDFLAEEV